MTSPLATNVKPADSRNPSVSKRASLWFLPFGQTGEANWKEFGNLIEPALNPAVTYLEHYTNRRGAKTRDRIEISEVKADFKFKIDELATEILQKIFGSSVTKASSTATLRDSAIYNNPGSGGAIQLPSDGLSSVIVRATNEEGNEVTYTADPLTTDTTDITAGGTLNNTTDPVVLVAASYPGTPTAVGSLIKIGSEILRITDFSGGNITLARAQLGTAAAAHANGVSIFKDAGGDYVAPLATGWVGFLPGGLLASGTTIPEVHIQWAKSVATEKFQLLDGTPIKGKAEFQILTKNGARIVATFNSVVIQNDGDIAFGDGSKWIETGLKLECLADSTGSLGDIHVIDAAATF